MLRTAPTAELHAPIRPARASRPTFLRLRQAPEDFWARGRRFLCTRSPRESYRLVEARRLHTPALKTAAAEARSSDFRASGHVSATGPTRHDLPIFLATPADSSIFSTAHFSLSFFWPFAPALLLLCTVDTVDSCPYRARSNNLDQPPGMLVLMGARRTGSTRCRWRFRCGTR